jgi:acetyl/propionyl-CoA carboxylase alpha subunit
MEVNTRIQVENGVSARIASIKGKGDVDLIAEQIRVGLGAPLGYSQKDIGLSGVGIEYRIIAEDPDNKFAPWVGRITSFGWPAFPWLKMHSQVPTDREYEIPTDFDPNLALAIIWGKDLAEAKSRGVEFLQALTLAGENASGEALKSNVEFLKRKTEGILAF